MPDIYGFRIEVREEEIGQDVVGFKALKHCLTALVMAMEETQSDKMICNTTWTVLYLINKAVEVMPRETERRWAALSRQTTEALSQRWRDSKWPEAYRPVDNSVDEDAPPF